VVQDNVVAPNTEMAIVLGSRSRANRDQAQPASHWDNTQGAQRAP
jgi:hypothetical protein